MHVGYGHGLGPIGKRLLLAFLVVALSSVAVLSVAALVGADRGLAASAAAGRETAAISTAAAAAAAYDDAGGWAGADLSHAVAVAAAAGAGLQVRDSEGGIVSGALSRNGNGRGAGPFAGGATAAEALPADSHTDPDAAARGYVSEPVLVAGQQVGTVRLGFGAPGSDSGRDVAWSWIAVATLAALGIAVVAAWYVTRRLTAPLVRLTRTVAAFAAGDRTARADITAPGELGALARTFDETADAIETSERVRRNLAADVAHELRTPLAVLQAGLEELRDGLVPADHHTLAALHDQSVRLARTVNDLAALAAAEAPALTATSTVVDLASVAASATAGSAAALRAAGVTVETDLEPVEVVADADRVGQILGNLLANVARYCRPGDTVRIRTSQDGDEGVLAVEDTGPGMDPDEIGHATERFWRGRHATGVAGSGLGLAIVAALAEAQHGRVSIASDGCHGTAVTLRLPADRRAAVSRPPAPVGAC